MSVSISAGESDCSVDSAYIGSWTHCMSRYWGIYSTPIPSLVLGTTSFSRERIGKRYQISGVPSAMANLDVKEYPGATNC